MTEYREGHVKHDVATQSVAQRTCFNEADPELADKAWVVITPRRFARHFPTSAVDAWDDLYTPPVE